VFRLGLHKVGGRFCGQSEAVHERHVRLPSQSHTGFLIHTVAWHTGENGIPTAVLTSAIGSHHWLKSAPLSECVTIPL
jgi:hypothetical protein